MMSNLDSQEFTGRVAVVTGGSRGLGRAIAEALSRQGAQVVIASRKLDVCEQVAAEIRRQTGNPAHGLRCHVGEWESCDELVASVTNRFEKVDMLVNNAGMSPLYPSLGEVTESLFDKVVDVNLKGAFRLAVSFGTRMVAWGGGSILNISSIAAVNPTPDELPYAAAKAGLNAMTKGLARAFAPNVRVNAVMPGMFATDVSASWDTDAVGRRVEQQVPLGRIGEPEELVGAALYLLGPSASYTTGAILQVDGGMAY
jgi:NAD(P)-dependent dehydrogenase (short-subunit alcohol dehydrogenase family)